MDDEETTQDQAELDPAAVKAAEEVLAQEPEEPDVQASPEPAQEPTHPESIPDDPALDEEGAT
jgi:hypothetical protein